MPYERGSRRSRRHTNDVNDEELESITNEESTQESSEPEIWEAPASSSRRALTHEAPKKAGKAIPYPLLAIASFLLSLTFYSFPFWNNLAASGQSQNLYSGVAMQQGLIPYNDFFGTGGSLFYLINYIGQSIGGTILLYLFGLVALFFSGVLVHNIVFRQTENKGLSLIIAIASLAIIAGLGHGGDTPTLFALPFALWQVRFIDSYLHEEQQRDEKFILFGMFGAVNFTLAPIMSLFFVLSILALFLYNVSHSRVGRGIYQFLAGTFGFVLIGYLVAYYALNEQTIYTSIEQSFLIPFGQFSIAGDFGAVALRTVLLLILSGFVFAFIYGIRQAAQSGASVIWYGLLLLGSLSITVVIFFNPAFDSTNLLAILPFLIVFVGRSVPAGNAWGYLRRYFFTPVLMLLFAAGLPLYYHFANQGINQQETTVGDYLRANTTSDDQVFALTADKNINLIASRSSDLDSVPAHFPKKYQQSFDLKAGQLKDKYVVLQSGQKVPDSLTNTLKSSYKAVNLPGVQDFSLFQHK